jgi:hypothetical protein
MQLLLTHGDPSEPIVPRFVGSKSDEDPHLAESGLDRRFHLVMPRDRQVEDPDGGFVEVPLLTVHPHTGRGDRLEHALQHPEPGEPVCEAEVQPFTSRELPGPVSRQNPLDDGGVRLRVGVRVHKFSGAAPEIGRRCPVANAFGCVGQRCHRPGWRVVREQTRRVRRVMPQPRATQPEIHLAAVLAQ